MSSLFGRKSSVPTVPVSTAKQNNLNNNNNITADTPETNQHIPQPTSAANLAQVQPQSQSQSSSSFDIISSQYQLPPIPTYQQLHAQQHQLPLTSSAPPIGVSHSTDLTENLKHMRLQNQNPLNNSLAVNNNNNNNNMQQSSYQQQAYQQQQQPAYNMNPQTSSYSTYQHNTGHQEPRQSVVSHTATNMIDNSHIATESVAAIQQPLVDGRRPSVQATNVTTTKNMKSISYAAERVIGNGSFGVVYQATVIETGETVAIKKVLQDRRFKNRELQIMGMLEHPDVVQLKHCFYSKGDAKDKDLSKDKQSGGGSGSNSAEPDIYLNLVMEFVPETIHRTIRAHTKANKYIPSMYVKVYMWQILRACNYIHSIGVCHRDIKPQNLLLNTKSHEVKMCDFGSAKQLVPGEPNVSYICSRYYRAPELVFEAVDYTVAIDIWSVGCVFGEMLLGNPLFPGESGVDQLIEIIKILGTPSKEEIYAMNPHHTSFKFPAITPHPWSKIFRNKNIAADGNAIDLLQQMLQYNPTKRINPLVALGHPYFDELRGTQLGGNGEILPVKLPNGKPLPNGVFDWVEMELKQMCSREGLAYKIMGERQAKEFKWPNNLIPK